MGRINLKDIAKLPMPGGFFEYYLHRGVAVVTDLLLQQLTSSQDA